MAPIKTLICEIRSDDKHHRDDNLCDGATYRVLYDDDQIIESTTSPVLAAAEALSSRGHAPDTVFALCEWHGGAVRCVIPIEHVTA
jgi:hypothetical protein